MYSISVMSCEESINQSRVIVADQTFLALSRIMQKSLDHYNANPDLNTSYAHKVTVREMCAVIVFLAPITVRCWGSRNAHPKQRNKVNQQI